MKKIFITGASGGIGSAIAKKFNDLKYKLILTSSSSDNLNNLREIYGSTNFYYTLNFINFNV